MALSQQTLLLTGFTYSNLQFLSKPSPTDNSSLCQPGRLNHTRFQTSYGRLTHTFTTLSNPTVRTASTPVWNNVHCHEPLNVRNTTDYCGTHCSKHCLEPLNVRKRQTLLQSGTHSSTPCFELTNNHPEPNPFANKWHVVVSNTTPLTWTQFSRLSPKLLNTYSSHILPIITNVSHIYWLKPTV